MNMSVYRNKQDLTQVHGFDPALASQEAAGGKIVAN